jgi:IclR family acetate operon transcriptional repressor
MLAVLEAVAAQQPVGTSALARQLEEDRSAVQRAIVTLANAGWIRATAESPVRWELSAHLFSLAHLPSSSMALRERARRVLENLRDQCGETILLAIPDGSRFVVIEVVESRHPLRMATRVGEQILLTDSATGRVVLALADAERQAAILGRKPTPAELAELEETRRRGFGLSIGEVMPGATTLAAPVFDARGDLLAAIVITGPSERISAPRHGEIGAMLVESAASLSQGRAQGMARETVLQA